MPTEQKYTLPKIPSILVSTVKFIKDLEKNGSEWVDIFYAGQMGKGSFYAVDSNGKVTVGKNDIDFKAQMIGIYAREKRVKNFS